jgi:Uma2 family endonuclease
MTTTVAHLAHPIGGETVQDWLDAEAPADGSRLELIWGYWHMAPPPGMPHQYAGDELRTLVATALREAGRGDLYVVTGVGVNISSALRTALIPDLVVIDVPPRGTHCEAEHVKLVVEIWSPGNTRAERETKAAAYADASVPWFWTLDESDTLTTYRLKDGLYVVDAVGRPGMPATITAAPVPITVDPADLRA